MAASNNPFTINGSLSFPPDEGQQQVAVPFGLAGNYKAITDMRLTLSGSGTQVVPFASVGSPGAKVVLVEYELPVGAAAQTAQPIQLHLNGGSEDIELSPGGFLIMGNPAPAVGITSLSLDYSSEATVRVRLMG